MVKKWSALFGLSGKWSRDFEKWSNLEAAHFKELKKNVKLVAQGKVADTKWKFGDKLKKMSSVVSKDDFDKAEYA